MDFLANAFQQLFSSSLGSLFSLANPGWDALVFVFLIIATLFFGLGLTKNKLIIFLFSTYITLAIIDSLPFVDSWWSNFKVKPELGPGFVFLVIMLFVGIFIFANIALKKYFISEETNSSIAHNFFLSLMYVGLVVHVALSSFPADVIALLSPFTNRLFVGDMARFFWFVVPLLTIIILTRNPEPRRPKTKEDEEDWREAYKNRY